jgi:diguanylate cyclase (GGDEF)-like protein
MLMEPHLELLANLVSPVLGALAVTALLLMSTVVTAGKRRRRQWILENREMEWADGSMAEGQTGRRRRPQRASDFLGDLARRLCYAGTFLSALGLIILPSVSVERSARLPLWLEFTGMTSAGALVLFLSWHGWDDDRVSVLRRGLRLAKERALSQRGLTVRDELTHLYTPGFWLRALEFRIARFLRPPTPITCLMIAVKGLRDLRKERGSAAVDVVLTQIGQEIARNVRPTDLVCRYHGPRFAIALFRCPARFGGSVGDRLAANVARAVLDGVTGSYRGRLRLQWEIATFPDEVSTPVRLLRVTGWALDRKMSLLGHLAVDGEGRAVADPDRRVLVD